MLASRKLVIKLLFSACVFIAGMELGCRLFWKLQGLSFLKCHRQMHLVFYPELRPIEEMSIGPGDGYYDVLLLGGSVLHEDFTPIAQLLGIELELEQNRHVRIHNASFRAHSSLDSYYKYRHLSGKKFDRVIVYHGINEVRANNCDASNFRRDYGHYFWYRALHLVEGTPRFRHLVFFRTLGLLWLKVSRGIGWDAYVPAAGADPDGLAYGGSVKTKGPFKRNLSRIIRLAEARADPLVLMTFGYYLPRGYLPGNRWHTSAKLWGLPQNVARGIDVHNTVIREMAKTYPGIMFVDQDKLIPKKDGFFRDVCHLTGKGSRSFVDNYLVTHYQEVLKTQDRKAAVHYRLANALARLRRRAAAADHYSRAIEIRPDLVEARAGLALIAGATGKGRQCRPENADGSVMKRFAGDEPPPQSFDSPERALEFLESRCRLHYNLGKAMEQQGRFEAAVSQYRQALQLRPDFGQARYDLELIQRLRRR